MRKITTSHSSDSIGKSITIFCKVDFFPKYINSFLMKILFDLSDSCDHWFDYVDGFFIDINPVIFVNENISYCIDRLEVIKIPIIKSCKEHWMFASFANLKYTSIKISFFTRIKECCKEAVQIVKKLIECEYAWFWHDRLNTVIKFSKKLYKWCLISEMPTIFKSMYFCVREILFVLVDMTIRNNGIILRVPYV